MMLQRVCSTVLAAVLGFVCIMPATAQNTVYPPLPAFHVPADIVVRHVNIYSAGTRMSGQFYSDNKYANRKLPTIIMAHGWGGLASELVREAVPFAQAGYLVLTFDYRGWGPSDSRIVLTQKSEPPNVQNYRFTAEVQEVREEVAPLNMVEDWQNALDFAVGDPQCDPNRIGLWGSSLSGGLVISVAERDPRVKVVHSQVPAMDGRWVLDSQMRGMTYDQSTKRAEDDPPYPAPGAVKLLGLDGVPILQQFASWFPIEEIGDIPKIPIEIVLAGGDTLVDNKANGLKAYPLIKGPKNLVIIPGINHFGIYNSLPAREEAFHLALTWFNRYLKPAGE